jgi:predicted phage terminase large subunit-like protein
MKLTAEMDGSGVIQYHEQEPGAGGKESAQATTRNLAGSVAIADRVSGSGDKVRRADPFSSQVNAGNVLLLRGEWNSEFIKECRLFPNGKYTDQVDSGSGAFNKLAGKRSVRRIR